ncbi:MoxR family ATPase [Mesorhizobium silamurunense]|uniref:MoxR family ATPase n=1 Tax=Mesorhizobium silamurunense TaxID=499528 RepID=UPI00177D7FFF|nr:MoxR family ATPase [Mesorhizobium silamurunense]
MTDIRLSTFDPVDLRGLPAIVDGLTKWLRPAIWPALDATEETILFFDEMDRAAPAVANAALQIVLERRIGEHVLPACVRIVAAGNGETDRTGTQKISSAQANRFTHLYAVADAEATAAHLARKGTHPAMPAFLRFRGHATADGKPGLIHGAPMPGEKAFPSPRAWEKVAGFIHLPAPQRSRLTRGTVGSAAAVEWEAFLRTYAGIAGLMADIMARPESADVPEEPSLQYAVSSAIARKADFASWRAVITYAARMPREFCIVTVLDAVRRDPRLKATAEYGAWAVANQDVAL